MTRRSPILMELSGCVPGPPTDWPRLTTARARIITENTSAVQRTALECSTILMTGVRHPCVNSFTYLNATPANQLLNTEGLEAVSSIWLVVVRLIKCPTDWLRVH